MIKLRIFINLIRFIPHVLLISFHPNKKYLISEYDQWLRILKLNYTGLWGFLFLLTFIKEYRNVFYLRLGRIGYLLNLFAGKSKMI
jgi:serine O-acetyltransferase